LHAGYIDANPLGKFLFPESSGFFASHVGWFLGMPGELINEFDGRAPWSLAGRQSHITLPTSLTRPLHGDFFIRIIRRWNIQIGILFALTEEYWTRRSRFQPRYSSVL
jgi:hypothetical protein